MTKHEVGIRCHLLDNQLLAILRLGPKFHQIYLTLGEISDKWEREQYGN